MLDRSVTVLLPQGEPGPVVRAAQDLVGDLVKVFGPGPRIVREEREAAPVSFEIGPAQKTAPGPLLANAESFSIRVESAHAKAKGIRIRLDGADMRGTMYAMYQFSEEFLGTDPMVYWTDRQPEHQDTLAVSRTLNKAYPAPVFRYRGFFINDEDLLTGWAPGEATDHTGISLAVWDKIFETTLRLKANMIVPGSFPFPDEPQERAVAERGLILHQHHAEPVGVDVARWPKDTPYNFNQHPEYLERAWKHAVDAVPTDQETLWTVGLRGLTDQAYSKLDPSVQGNPQAEGDTIGRAIREEMRIVRARQPNAVFATNLWQEGAELVRKGFLKLPPEVLTVWPDTGYGDIQDNGEVRAGQGAYVHVAMMNRGANQLTELVSLDKLFSELGRFQAAGATGFLLLNTSDIRPVTMGGRGVMEFGWRGKAVGSADNFYQQFAREEFGDELAQPVAELYRQYYAAPALRPDGTNPIGDQFYHTQVRNLALKTMVSTPLWLMPTQSPLWRAPYPLFPSGDPDPVVSARELAIRCRQAEPRWDALWQQATALASRVPQNRRDFYQAQVLTAIAVNRESNRMLLAFSESLEALHNNDRPAAEAKVAEAQAAVGRLREAEHAAEYGKWAHWYRGDWHTGVAQTEDTLVGFARWLRDPDAPLPAPMSWSLWEAYYHILHYQGLREVNVQEYP